jgi:hypothetical protein
MIYFLVCQDGPRVPIWQGRYTNARNLTSPENCKRPQSCLAAYFLSFIFLSRSSSFPLFSLQQSWSHFPSFWWNIISAIVLSSDLTNLSVLTLILRPNSPSRRPAHPRFGAIPFPVISCLFFQHRRLTFSPKCRMADAIAPHLSFRSRCHHG